MHDGAVQLKHLRQFLHGDGVVDVGVCEQVSAEGLLLDQPLQHCSHLVGLGEQVPNLDKQNANLSMEFLEKRQIKVQD